MKAVPDSIRVMVRIFQQLSDRLLSQLVPKVAADAGCRTDPYTYYRQCSCWPAGNGLTCCYYETCRVYSNCSVRCVGYCNVEGCW